MNNGPEKLDRLQQPAHNNFTLRRNRLVPGLSELDHNLTQQHECRKVVCLHAGIPLIANIFAKAAIATTNIFETVDQLNAVDMF